MDSLQHELFDRLWSDYEDFNVLKDFCSDEVLDGIGVGDFLQAFETVDESVSTSPETSTNGWTHSADQ